MAKFKMWNHLEPTQETRLASLKILTVPVPRPVWLFTTELNGDSILVPIQQCLKESYQWRTKTWFKGLHTITPLSSFQRKELRNHGKRPWSSDCNNSREGFDWAMKCILPDSRHLRLLEWIPGDMTESHVGPIWEATKKEAPFLQDPKPDSLVLTFQDEKSFRLSFHPPPFSFPAGEDENLFKFGKL